MYKSYYIQLMYFVYVCLLYIQLMYVTIILTKEKAAEHLPQQPAAPIKKER